MLVRQKKQIRGDDMKKNNPKIIITLFSIILGIFIILQVKMKLEIYKPITINSLQIAKMEVESIKKEIIELEKVEKQKQEELIVLENISKGDDNIIDILNQDLEKNKIYSGISELKGPGIVISMYDNQEKRDWWFDINKDVIHDVDILNILNDLKVAGAEAISINDERVIATSEIKCGGPIIRINGRSSGIPFLIKAIGDTKLLMASVSAPGTNGDILKNVYNKGFEVEVKDKIIIPSYKGMFDFKYAKPLGESD